MFKHLHDVVDEHHTALEMHLHAIADILEEGGARDPITEIKVSSPQLPLAFSVILRRGGRAVAA